MNSSKTPLRALLKRLTSIRDPESLLLEGIYPITALTTEDLLQVIQFRFSDTPGVEKLENLAHNHGEEIDPAGSSVYPHEKRLEIIDEMVKEHQEILKSLKDLEIFIPQLYTHSFIGSDLKTSKKIETIASVLLNAETHHKKEETILFPELERLGVIGPLVVLDQEHDQLRNRKRELKELIDVADKIDLEILRLKFSAAATYLVHNLRDHIFIENYIIYPFAVQLIRNPEIWESLRLY